jgi:hypothetical protein
MYVNPEKAKEDNSKYFEKRMFLEGCLLHELTSQ